MKKVIHWETKDGLEFNRRIDAAAHERAVRKAGCAAMKSFLITCDADEALGRTGRLPGGAWIDAGLVLYVWNCVCGVDAAIRRAMHRCDSLRQRTELDWRIDEDMQVGPQTEADAFLYIGDREELRAYMN